MKFDLILSGVGGQGILSIAFITDNSAMKQGLYFKQSEVHGMAQRGGAVSSHLRVADHEIFSDLVPLGHANMLLSVEPMEALRYEEFLGEGGTVVSSTASFENIGDYPPVETILKRLGDFPRLVLVNGNKIAREAGSGRAQNMVILGAAAPYLPLEQAVMEEFIGVLFGKKGEKMIQTNVKAFRYGLANGKFYANAMEVKADPTKILAVMDRLDSGSLEPEAAGAWARILDSDHWAPMVEWWDGQKRVRFPGDVATAERILAEGHAFLA